MATLTIANGQLTLNFDGGRNRYITLPLKEVVRDGDYVVITSQEDQSESLLYSEWGYGSAALLETAMAALADSEVLAINSPDYIYEVALGNVANATTWNKFGYNLTPAQDTEEIIASWSGTFTPMTSADTLDIVSTSGNDAAGLSGARLITIIGIDENGLAQTENIAPTGLTPATTQNQWLGINRMYVVSAGATASAEGTITVTDTSGSFGTQGEIPAGGNVTQQCIFFTQTAYTFLATLVIGNVRRVTSGGQDVRYTIRGYSYSRVTGLAYEVFRIDGSTRTAFYFDLEPTQPFVIGGQEVLYFTIEADTANAVCNLRFSGIERPS